jgi:hypothetical protein
MASTGLHSTAYNRFLFAFGRQMTSAFRLAVLRAMVAASVTIAGQTAALPDRSSSAPPTPSASGTQTPTFRLDVDYVEVDAVVTDEDGRFVALRVDGRGPLAAG